MHDRYLCACLQLNIFKLLMDIEYFGIPGVKYLFMETPGKFEYEVWTSLMLHNTICTPQVECRLRLLC
jgi:hypothetical protein